MKYKWNLLIFTIFTLGVLIISYPFVSNALAKRNHTRLIQEYQITIKQLSEQIIQNYFEEAEAYNRALAGTITADPFVPSSGYGIMEGYTNILNVNGIIGYLEIPVISVRLPIYHTVRDDVLKKGVGHMEQTAFPIGGAGNHSALTAHRGLPSAKLFTDLNKVETGDSFQLYILDRILNYEVDQILVVDPDDTSPLEPVPGEDYVTLITCTPYAINSHRLLVRGTRSQEESLTPDEEEENHEENQKKELETYLSSPFVIIPLVSALTIGGGVVFYLYQKNSKFHKKNVKDDEQP